MAPLTLLNEDLVRPPTPPDVGPPIPGKRIGTVPTIIPDDPPAKVAPVADAQARALHRAIHNANHGPWEPGGY